MGRGKGKSGRTGSGRQSRGSSRSDFQRTDRVGELIREIVADELRRIDDDELQFVTVTGVDVDRDLFRAQVYLSTLDLDPSDIEAIEEHSKRLRQAVARQARLRKTPELVFQIDPALIAGSRIDGLLADQPPTPAEEEPPVPGRAAWADESAGEQE